MQSLSDDPEIRRITKALQKALEGPRNKLLQALDRLSKSSSDRAMLALVAGRCFVEWGDIDWGIEMFRDSLSMRESAEAHASLAEALFYTGHVDEAFTHLKAATRLDPQGYPAKETNRIVREKKRERKEFMEQLIPSCVTVIKHLSRFSATRVERLYKEIEKTFHPDYLPGGELKVRCRLRSLDQYVSIAEIMCYFYVASKMLRREEPVMPVADFDSIYDAALAMTRGSIH